MKQHILVVDDEPQIRELLSLYLQKQGYDVSTASSSAETLACLSGQPVNLVVLDIGLAQEDGLRLLEHLKASHPEVRVIMLTGMGFVEDLLQEAHDKGADGYVSKVLPLDELLIAIERVSHGTTAPQLTD
jgi:DNA-binding response OmpR family regulator